MESFKAGCLELMVESNVLKFGMIGHLKERKNVPILYETQATMYMVPVKEIR